MVQVLDIEVSCEDFIYHCTQMPSSVMWFLGAGTSRSAGMPTATDIIWDLKRRYYCLNENVDIDTQDINNFAIKNRIQSYMDSKGFPALWSSEEYSFYFDLLFKGDYGRQQTFLNSALSPDKVSLNVGHRILAGMMGSRFADVVFTTNFDEVVETAYSKIASKNLSTFHIEGSYAALEALNSNRLPIYIKLHGDFRYQSIKNLSQDLKKNDEELKRCFLAAATRYGLIVSGYSGRDANVMLMLEEALQQNNAFPRGFFWTVFSKKDVPESVLKILKLARSLNIRSGLVETGTFDEMMGRLWKQIPNKDDSLTRKIKSATLEETKIDMPGSGDGYPILRMNALPIVSFPNQCGVALHSSSLTYKDVKNCVIEAKANATVTFTDKIFFWGKVEEVKRAFENISITEFKKEELINSIDRIEESTHLKEYFERALVSAITSNAPVNVRKRRGTYFVFVKKNEHNNPFFGVLRQALEFKGNQGYVSGKVNGVEDAYWSEAVTLQLEIKNGKAWLLIRPDIWITPGEKRELAIEFLRKRKLYRWNRQSNQLLDAWIKILFGGTGNKTVKKVAYEDSEYPAAFEICVRTAFSRPGGIS